MELEVDELLPPPPPPPPPPPLPLAPLEAVEDVVEPDEDVEPLDDVPEDPLDDVLDDEPPDAVFVVEVPVSAPLLAEFDATVLLVPGAAVAAEVVDCICMILEFNTKRCDAAVRGNARQRRRKIPESCPIQVNGSGV